MQKFAIYELRSFSSRAWQAQFLEKMPSIFTAGTRKCHFLDRRGSQLLLILWSHSQSREFPPALGGLCGLVCLSSVGDGLN